MAKVTTSAPSPEDEPSTHEQKSPFPHTTDSIWERIEKAGDGDSGALGELCLIYQKAILAYVSRWQRNRHEAEDLSQKFIARMLQKNPFQQFERRNVRFRSFLLRCLKFFLRDQWKGGPPPGEILDDNVAAEHNTVSTLDVALSWDIHERVLQRIADEYCASEQMRARFDRLKPFIRNRDDTYSDHAAPLGMTPGNLRKFIHQLRERHHDLFRAEVINLVSREQLVEEMRYLMGLLAYQKPNSL